MTLPKYLAFVAACVSACAASLLQPSALSTRLEDNYDWAKLKPSKELVWHDCYTGRQCARLIVPLNYDDPDGETAAIAIARLPSRLPKDSADYRGPVLINPGGPGGSGVDMAVGRGPLLAAIVGPEFDIVGFDPRGIGRSTPKASFFQTAVEGTLWGAAGSTVVDAGTDQLAHAWGRAQIAGQLAGERDTGGLKYINTDHTARDMLSIVEAHGREKLQYWGFSYGTVLGSTFASIFPDKIERMVIDGVVDMENYYATLWNNNLMDTDKTMQSFFDACAEAGPDGCAFAADTAADISKNLTALYNKIRATPVPVRTSGSYGLIDYNRLRWTVFRALYSPYAAFAPLAQGLADLAAGNGTALFRLLEDPAFQCSCDSSKFLFEQVPDAQTAVMCNDGKDVPHSFEHTKKFFEDFYSVTAWADVWVNIRTGCTGWPEFTNKHFQGPVGAKKTSFPLLVVSNTADPVTPLWAAKKTSRAFPGSVVLTQDSPGHCSISGPSICTQRYIRDYFKNGTFPDAGTVCPVLVSPFPDLWEGQVGSDQSRFVTDDMSPEDRSMLDAVWELSSLFER